MYQYFNLNIQLEYLSALKKIIAVCLSISLALRTAIAAYRYCQQNRQQILRCIATLCCVTLLAVLQCFYLHMSG